MNYRLSRCLSVLLLSAQLAQNSIAGHVPFEIKTPQDEHIKFKERKGYEIVFNKKLNAPYYVAHTLTDWYQYKQNNEVAKKTVRKNYRRDSLNGSDFSKCLYKDTHYTGGHMAPAGDMAFADEKETAQALKETYCCSNILPQVAKFNGGLWLQLENLGRGLSKAYGEKYHIYCVSGPVFEGDQIITMLRDVEDVKNRDTRVPIPHAFFKIFYMKPRSDSDDVRLLCFKVPHVSAEVQKQVDQMEDRFGGIALLEKAIKKPAESIEQFHNYLVSLSEIEACTGLKFLPSSDSTKEQFLYSNPVTLEEFMGLCASLEEEAKKEILRHTCEAMEASIKEAEKAAPKRAEIKKLKKESKKKDRKQAATARNQCDEAVGERVKDWNTQQEKYWKDLEVKLSEQQTKDLAQVEQLKQYKEKLEKCWRKLCRNQKKALQKILLRAQESNEMGTGLDDLKKSQVQEWEAFKKDAERGLKALCAASGEIVKEDVLPEE
jgi:DNA/RNA endonuclease G (NUC1)